MCARERRVVAADLGAGALGMRQEVQIVDRDDLRRVARRHQQRMQRVRDVERAAGQRFRRRPVEPMPRQIQQRDRDAAIDALPRRAAPSSADRRSFHELENRVTSTRAAAAVVDEAARAARDELMGVFADAAPLAQRRTVIDQDAHLFKSFRVSILL